MDLIVHWILRAATPLALAASKGKRKPVKKKVKRRAFATRTRGKKSARASRRPTRRASRGKKSARPSRRPPRRASRGKPVTVPARRPVPLPATPAVAPRPVAPELPKPVPPIGRAILLSPENDKFVDNFHPTFRWLSVGGATRYEIGWGEDPALSSSHAIFSIATETAVPGEKPLRLGGTYYWRVRGGNESGWGPWSAVASFHVLEETT